MKGEQRQYPGATESHKDGEKLNLGIYSYLRLMHLLVDPSGHGGLVVAQLLLLEPQSDLLLSRLDRVRAVADVSAHVQGKVTSDGTRGRGQGVGGTQNGSTGLDSILTLPNSGENRSRQHVGQQGGEEGLGLQVSVVLLQLVLRGRHQLDGDQLETSVLKARENGGNEASLDTIRLNSDKSSLGVGHFVVVVVG